MQSAHSHENEVAGYVDFRQDITEWLTIDAGLRYDHHSTAGGEWVPQAGVVVRPIETGALKASVSKGFLGTNFNCQKWSIIAGLQYLNGLYTAVGDAETKEIFWNKSALQPKICKKEAKNLEDDEIMLIFAPRK